MDFSSFSAQVLESFNQQQAAAASGLQNIVGNVQFPIASTLAHGTPHPPHGALAVGTLQPESIRQQQNAAAGVKLARPLVIPKTAKVRSTKQLTHVVHSIHKKASNNTSSPASTSSRQKQQQQSRNDKDTGRRKWSPNRKAAGFWSPFNDWWRLEFEKLRRRPTTEEVSEWYSKNADKAWPGQKPTVKETRRHAKCLRTTEDVRNYFRKYRAKRSVAQTKKNGGGGSGVGGGNLPAKVNSLAADCKAFLLGQANPAAGIHQQQQQDLVGAHRGLNPAAWIQPGTNGFFNHGNIGAFATAAATQNDMVAAVYRNYQAQAAAQAQAQLNQVQAQAIMQNHTNLAGLYMNANGRTLVRDVQYVRPATTTKSRAGPVGAAAGTEHPSESPSSAETTEVVGIKQEQATLHLETQHTENACLSSMIGIIEKSRSLTNTPTPAIPWRHEEVSTAFQEDNHLENIKLDYTPHTHAIHILPAAVVDSTESNGEHYIDGL
jgi:hypothetical protein